MKNVFLFLGLLLASQAVMAEDVYLPKGRTACDFGAFVSETDPKGLNVRSGPGTSFPIIATLPPLLLMDDGEFDSNYRVKIDVRVTAGENGWFRIYHAQDNTMTGIDPRKMFRGSGWVSGKKLAVKSYSEVGRAAPRKDAPVILAYDSYFDSLLMDGHLVACKGEWAYAAFEAKEADDDLKAQPAARVTGRPGYQAWFNHLCPIQETTCSPGDD